MQKSIASSPLVPLLTAVGAGLLIFGTLSNGNIKDSGDPSLASSQSSCDPTFDPTCAGASASDPSAGGPATSPTDTTPATTPAAGEAYTLVLGQAADAGGVTMTVTKVTKAAATVTVGKKSYTLKAGKPTAVGKNKLTYNTFKGKNVTITVA